MGSQPRRTVDYNLVEQLLREGYSCRAAARAANCSDWTARRVLRHIIGDDTPMKSARSLDDGEPIGVVGWLALAALVIGLIWLAVRGQPEGGQR